MGGKKKGGGGMKKALLGVVLGLILLFLFLYFGGPEYLAIFGKKTEETGQSLKQYEKTTKETVKKVGEKVDEVKKKFE